MSLTQKKEPNQGLLWLKRRLKSIRPVISRFFSLFWGEEIDSIKIITTY